MAEINLNPLVENVTGRYGRIILRRHRGKVFMARPPTQGDGPTSPALLDVRRQFREASLYSKAVFALPDRRAPYEAMAEAADKGVFPTIMTDFLRKPVIRVVNTSGYHGQVGDPIDVRTRADLGIADVTVTLLGDYETVLESGAAVDVDGIWRYTATTAIAAGTAVTLTVTVKDGSNIELTRTLPLVVA